MLCVLWQKDRAAVCQAELWSQGFSEMSKTCWFRTASPLLVSPRNESFKSCLLESHSNLLALDSLLPL